MLRLNFGTVFLSIELDLNIVTTSFCVNLPQKGGGGGGGGGPDLTISTVLRCNEGLSTFPSACWDYNCIYGCMQGN